MTERRLPPPTQGCTEILVVWRGPSGEIGFTSCPFAPYAESADSVDPGVWGALLGAAGRHVATSLEEGLEETTLSEILTTIREAFCVTLANEGITTPIEHLPPPDRTEGADVVKVERVDREKRSLGDLSPGTVFSCETKVMADVRGSVMMVLSVPKNVAPPSFESVACVVLEGDRAGTLVWVSRTEGVLEHEGATLRIGA